MTQFEKRGNEIRALAKSLVWEFMRATRECQPGKEGMTLSHIFRKCGFDWGDYTKTTSGRQQSWVGAILWELKKEGKVERVSESGPWRLL
jgi:hypothetical protein